MPIFDQGYQHWQGQLSGHAWRALAIARQGLRVQLRNRNVRVLLILAWIPAVALVVLVALWGLFEQKTAGILTLFQMLLPREVLVDPHAYRKTVWTLAYVFFFKTEMFFIMLLVVAAGPNLISADLRFNALPLYFSRPLRRIDYFLGKLGVIAAVVAAVAVGPAVLAYFVGVIFSFSLSIIRDTCTLLFASIAYGLIITLSAGTLMLALSSLSRRSLYVGISWFGLWWVSSGVAQMLTAMHVSSVTRDIFNRQPQEVQRQVDAAGNNAAARVRAQQEAWQRGQQEFEAAVARAQRDNWRPVFSYTANLERIGEGLLGADAAWTTLGRAIARSTAMVPGQPMAAGHVAPVLRDERFLADELTLQFPWFWSAGVLAALLGVSAWTLHRRVRSLDRLK